MIEFFSSDFVIAVFIFSHSSLISDDLVYFSNCYMVVLYEFCWVLYSYFIPFFNFMVFSVYC